MTWFVMRDLTRANANHPAWKQLSDAGFEVFTPLVWKILKKGGKGKRVLTPAIHDLLFVNSTRPDLDPTVARIPTLQYRFVKGGAFGEAMTVNETDMNRFIRAVSSSEDTLFYTPSEISPSMIGKKVEIIGGPLSGMSGNLLSIKGMRKRRLIVELPGMLTSAVEVSPDYIKFI